jgi:RNA methyltransferase, TrmH family
MKEITSKNNQIIKHFKKLISNASYRYDRQSAIITGDIIINEISSILTIKTLLLCQVNSLKAEQSYLISQELARSISQLPSLQGSIAEVSIPPYQDISHLKKIAIFDRIADPGNMGMMMRSALAFGIDGIHITKGSCDPFNDKVIRSSKGAVFKIPLSYEPFTSLNTNNFNLLLADMGGELIEKIDTDRNIALLLSNETKGLDPKWEGQKVGIKMAEELESLNVGVAASILFYECAKEKVSY